MSKETTATRRTGAAGTIDVSLPAAEATDIHVLIIDDSEDDALVTIRSAAAILRLSKGLTRLKP
jgi:hypothetical protein